MWDNRARADASRWRSPNRTARRVWALATKGDLTGSRRCLGGQRKPETLSRPRADTPELKRVRAPVRRLALVLDSVWQHCHDALARRC